MKLPELEPGIFFLLLWGLFSWLSRKKKKKTDRDLGEVLTKPNPKEDLFARLQNLRDNLSQKFEIVPSDAESAEVVEKYLQNDEEFDFEESEIPVPELEDVQESEGYVFEADIKAPTTVSENWLKQNLSRKSDLKKLMVLRDVLGEPRSLKPYTGDYFQS